MCLTCCADLMSQRSTLSPPSASLTAAFNASSGHLSEASNLTPPAHECLNVRHHSQNVVHRRAAVPRHGMKTISQQLGSRLPSSSVHVHVPVRSVTASAVRVDSGEVDASAVVIATDGNSAAELLGRPRHTPRSTGCVWFDAPEAPTDRRLIVLDGDRLGRVKCCGHVKRHPDMPHQAGTPCRSCSGFTGADLEQQARSQLTSWWGSSVQGWTTLRVDEIEYGHDQTPHFSPKRSVEVEPHLYVAITETRLNSRRSNRSALRRSNSSVPHLNRYLVAKFPDR